MPAKASLLRDRDVDVRRLEGQTGYSAARLKELERIATRRNRAAVGSIALLLGVFFIYPSWRMCTFLFLVLLWGMTRIPKLQVSVFSGLPYGKMAPVVLARKPWWHTIFCPLDPEIRCLWTGLVSIKSVRRMQLIGRVRVLLVADTWYLQCADSKLGWRVNVRAPLGSPLWRTCYACPASDSKLPPPSSDGGWRYVGTGAGVKKAENSTLHLEVDAEVVSEWFRRRRRADEMRRPSPEEERRERKAPRA